MAKTDIALGNEVEDVVLHRKGIVLAICQQLNGNLRYAIQPPQKEDGTVPEGFDHDDVNCDYIGVGVADRLVPADPNAPELLGKRCRDKLTGFVGVATNKWTFLNGCVHYGLAGPASKPGKKPEYFTTEWQRLEIAPEPAPSITPSPAHTTQEGSQFRGGPATRTPRV